MRLDVKRLRKGSMVFVVRYRTVALFQLAGRRDGSFSPYALPKTTADAIDDLRLTVLRHGVDFQGFEDVVYGCDSYWYPLGRFCTDEFARMFGYRYQDLHGDCRFFLLENASIELSELTVEGNAE
jgi:hypothetical protein